MMRCELRYESCHRRLWRVDLPRNTSILGRARARLAPVDMLPTGGAGPIRATPLDWSKQYLGFPGPEDTHASATGDTWRGPR
jgi:hypothetical protein